MSSATTAAFVLALAGHASAFLSNGLAVTPQMGWDNWNAFGCDVSEDLLLGTATRMKELGLGDAGYNYVILDDCWSNGRSSNGTLQPNLKKFPNGMAHVATSIHNLGLKYGMYSDAGLYTCGQYAGSLGHETVDADTFAGWGVDYLKYDNCYNQGQSGNPYLSFTRYDIMHKALNNTNRPILYSMCNWGEDGPWAWAETIANSWRISGDVTDEFNRPDPRCPCSEEQGLDCKLPGYHCSVMNIINKSVYYLNKGQPGAWNDFDMLEIGNGGMSDNEYKVMFTMWAAAKSPLIMGTDIRSLSPQSYSIYMNPAIIALNQDPLGTSVQRLYRYYTNEKNQWGQPGEYSMFAGPLYGDNQVVILLNAGDSDREMNATLAEIFVDSGGANSPSAKMSYDMFDLWANRMDNATASAILMSNSTTGGNYTQSWLNTTQTSYADALAANDTRVMGKQCGTVQANGMLSAMVPSHGVAAFRLRPKQSTMKRDEL